MNPAIFCEIVDDKLQMLRTEGFHEIVYKIWNQMFTECLRDVAKNCKFWAWSAGKAYRSCRAWKVLQNEPLVAKIGFDTTANGPSKAWVTGIPVYRCKHRPYRSSLSASCFENWTTSVVSTPQPGDQKSLEPRRVELWRSRSILLELKRHLRGQLQSSALKGIINWIHKLI